MEVAIMDAGGANIGSIRYALQRLGAEGRLTSDPDEIAAADRVILPGVGAAGAGMERLRALGLVDVVRTLRRPLLGICLGMQLLYESSDENDTECLGLIPGRVGRMAPAPGIRVPHMGWNALRAQRPDPLLAGIDDDAQAYFVHGYAAPANADALATFQHGGTYAAVVRRGRCWGVQFHPERSSEVGARVLRNFLSVALA